MEIVNKIYNSFLDKIKNLDKTIIKIIKIGFIICSSLTVISVILLFTYHIYSKPNLFYIGIELLKNALMFACMFLIFGIGFDTIKKDMI